MLFCGTGPAGSHLADIFEDLSGPQWDEEGGPFGPGPDHLI